MNEMLRILVHETGHLLCTMLGGIRIQKLYVGRRRGKVSINRIEYNPVKWAIMYGLGIAAEKAIYGSYVYQYKKIRGNDIYELQIADVNEEHVRIAVSKYFPYFVYNEPSEEERKCLVAELEKSVYGLEKMDYQDKQRISGLIFLLSSLISSTFLKDIILILSHVLYKNKKRILIMNDKIIPINQTMENIKNGKNIYVEMAKLSSIIG